MMELEFALTQAKAAQDGRLSVSRETKSEILGTRRLDRPEIREMVFPKNFRPVSGRND